MKPILNKEMVWELVAKEMAKNKEMESDPGSLDIRYGRAQILHALMNLAEETI